MPVFVVDKYINANSTSMKLCDMLQEKYIFYSVIKQTAYSTSLLSNLTPNISTRGCCKSHVGAMLLLLIIWESNLVMASASIYQLQLASFTNHNLWSTSDLQILIMAEYVCNEKLHTVKPRLNLFNGEKHASLSYYIVVLQYRRVLVVTLHFIMSHN